MKKVIMITLLMMIILSINGCTKQQQINLQSKQIDLCNEISNPGASVNCEERRIDQYSSKVDCYLSISGDSRVSYRFYEYGVYGFGGSGVIQAGDTAILNSNQQDRVEVIPYNPSDYQECTNRKVVIYRNQFTGQIPDISHLYKLYNR